MSRLGDLIRLERTRQGLTHKQVARKCGVSDKYLMEVEAGTRIIQDDLNETVYTGIRNWTVSQLREWILNENTTEDQIQRVSRGLTSEMVAAVTKLMSNLDLIYAAAKIRVTAHCNTTIGLRGTLSCRLQPNHTTDDPDGILASLSEGLSFGAGDAVKGRGI